MTLPTRDELVRAWVRLFATYQDVVTWFGSKSVARAFGIAVGELASMAVDLKVALLRRFTLLGASGEDLIAVAAEHGVRPLPDARSRLLLVVVPETTTVTAITLGSGPVAGGDELEVEDSSAFGVGASIRIRNVDGSTTEAQTIVGISAASGPGGGDELEVGTLAGTYAPRCRGGAPRRQRSS